jgi:PilZ domain
VCSLVDLENEGRRSSPRFPCSVEVTGAVLSTVERPEEAPVFLRGMMQNISRGGVGMISDQLPTIDAVVRCEFAVLGSEAVIPSLLKVRWCRVQGTRQYRLGLEFLL